MASSVNASSIKAVKAAHLRARDMGVHVQQLEGYLQKGYNGISGTTWWHQRYFQVWPNQLFK